MITTMITMTTTTTPTITTMTTTTITTMITTMTTHDDHGDEEEDHEVAIDLDSRRRVGRFDIGARNLNNSLIDGFKVSLTMIDWEHDELEIEEGIESIGTRCSRTRPTLVRAEVDQRQTERLCGQVRRLGAAT